MAAIRDHKAEIVEALKMADVVLIHRSTPSLQAQKLDARAASPCGEHQNGRSAASVEFQGKKKTIASANWRVALPAA
ncbi:MAG: hypothetical protein IT507_11440 [Burkholderiaceae bacterium]|nr:hypothetical protein [Burkholderiaceae bacterium]